MVPCTAETVHTLNSKLSIPDQSCFRCKISSVSGFLYGLKVDKTLLFTGHTDAYG